MTKKYLYKNIVIVGEYSYKAIYKGNDKQFVLCVGGQTKKEILEVAKRQIDYLNNK